MTAAAAARSCSWVSAWCCGPWRWPAVPGKPAPAPKNPPSVLLVIVDTLRADRLGTYGFAQEASPNIDRFAAGAVVLERAISGASSTSASHASIFTSRYTRQHTIGML